MASSQTGFAFLIKMFKILPFYVIKLPTFTECDFKQNLLVPSKKKTLHSQYGFEVGRST